jgi:predicted ATPase
VTALRWMIGVELTRSRDAETVSRNEVMQEAAAQLGLPRQETPEAAEMSLRRLALRATEDLSDPELTIALFLLDAVALPRAHRETPRRIGEKRSALSIWLELPNGAEEFKARYEIQTMRALSQRMMRRVEFDDSAGPDRASDQPLDNLPFQLSTFVGRHRELAEIENLWTLPSTRLVTLTGSGGVGKTRLALEFARKRIAGTAEGVWFVDLAPISDTSLVVQRTASVLGVRQEPDRPMLDTLADALRATSTFILLDNCEHVIGDAAKLAQQLAESCPRVDLLATSREPLGVSGERIYRVPPLSLPLPNDENPDSLSVSEAVSLFCERATEQRLDFALDSSNAAAIGRLCRRLDGVPLAIELATARLRSMSIEDIGVRLDQRFSLLKGGARSLLPRHQTLEALIDWSYDLLNPLEQTLLKRLSVFAGGFDLHAVEAVVKGGLIDDYSVAALVSSLVDKSLVQADNFKIAYRYRLLETVREYAHLRLTASDDPEADGARLSHRDYYLSLAVAAAPHLVEQDQVEYLDRLDLEHDNLLLALDHCLSDRDPDPGLQLSVALNYFWLYRDHVAEGMAALSAQLDRPEAQNPSVLRGTALAALGYMLANFTVDYSVARERTNEAVAIGRNLGDDRLVVRALYALAMTCARSNEFDVAASSAKEALDVATNLGDPDLLGRLYLIRAVFRSGEDPYSDYEKSLEFFRSGGNRMAAVSILSNMGYEEMSTGELDQARLHLDEAVQIARALFYKTGVCYSSCNRGYLAYLDGDDDTAQEMFAESLRIAFRSGDLVFAAVAQLGLALTKSRKGDTAQAATLHGVVSAILSQLGTQLQVLESRLGSEDLAQLRHLLGDAAFQAAYEEGRNMPLEDSVALALSLGRN